METIKVNKGFQIDDIVSIEAIQFKFTAHRTFPISTLDNCNCFQLILSLLVCKSTLRKCGEVNIFNLKFRSNNVIHHMLLNELNSSYPFDERWRCIYGFLSSFDVQANFSHFVWGKSSRIQVCTYRPRKN